MAEETTSTIRMPGPDPRILARKVKTVTALERLLPADSVLSNPEETRAYGCDALSAGRSQ